MEKEIAELKAQLVIQEKIVRDRERQARQDKKAIEFLEGDKRRSRGEVQETREILDTKEQEVRNLKKDIENL